MGDKPVIVAVRMHNPCVLAELEPASDAIIVDFGVLLPRDMETVEAHCEDKPLDLVPYVDSAENAFDFGFGLNWFGVIRDERTERYSKSDF